MKPWSTISCLVLTALLIPTATHAAKPAGPDTLIADMCSNDPDRFMPRVLEMLEFNIRMDYSSDNYNGMTLDQILDQAREQIRTNISSEDMMQELCEFGEPAVGPCPDLLLPPAPEAEAEESHERFARDKTILADVLGDMGIQECALFTGRVKPKDAGTVLDIEVRGGRTADAWILLNAQSRRDTARQEDALNKTDGIAEMQPMKKGPCEYRAVPGEMIITQVRPADPGMNNCDNDPVEVLFNFEPDDPAARAGYRMAGWPDQDQHLTIGSGQNPPRAWVAAQALNPGARFSAERLEILAGTCTPVLFETPALDKGAALEDCYGTPE